MQGNANWRAAHSFAPFANEWGLSEHGLPESLPWLFFDLQRPLLKIHAHRSSLSKSIRPEAAPAPLIGLHHQPALHRIAGHIAQLLDALALASHIEIIEPLLPHMRVARLRPKRALPRAGTTLPHQARETLFHHFHHHRRVVPLGLADQQNGCVRA